MGVNGRSAGTQRFEAELEIVRLPAQRGMQLVIPIGRCDSFRSIKFVFETKEKPVQIAQTVSDPSGNFKTTNC